MGVEGVGGQAEAGLGCDEAAEVAGVPVALPAGRGQDGVAVGRGLGPELGEAPRSGGFAAGREQGRGRRQRQEAASRYWQTSTLRRLNPSDSSFKPLSGMPRRCASSRRPITIVA